MGVNRLFANTFLWVTLVVVSACGDQNSTPPAEPLSQPQAPLTDPQVPLNCMLDSTWSHTGEVTALSPGKIRFQRDNRVNLVTAIFAADADQTLFIGTERGLCISRQGMAGPFELATGIEDGVVQQVVSTRNEIFVLMREANTIYFSQDAGRSFTRVQFNLVNPPIRMTRLTPMPSGRSLVITAEVGDGVQDVGSSTPPLQLLYSWPLEGHQPNIQVIEDTVGVRSLIVSQNRVYVFKPNNAGAFTPSTDQTGSLPFFTDDEFQSGLRLVLLTPLPPVTNQYEIIEHFEVAGHIVAAYSDVITNALFLVEPPREMGDGYRFWEMTGESPYVLSEATSGFDSEVHCAFRAGWRYFAPHPAREPARANVKSIAFAPIYDPRTNDQPRHELFIEMPDRMQDLAVQRIQASESLIFVITNHGLFYRQGLSGSR